MYEYQISVTIIALTCFTCVPGLYKPSPPSLVHWTAVSEGVQPAPRVSCLGLFMVLDDKNKKFYQVLT